MNQKELLKQELEVLGEEVPKLLKLVLSTYDFSEFNAQYQSWYTRALQVVSRLAPERLDDFRGYYQIDPKRKNSDSSNYVIQDYLRGTGARVNVYDKPLWDIHNSLSIAILNQANILKSLISRVDGVLANIEISLLSEIQDAELATADKLKKTSLRAAGALAGVILEDHLQRVANSKGVRVGKRNPTISDLNDPLKQAGVYDTSAWRKIQYLADLRNLCSHKKDREPTEDEINDLLGGVNWLIKNVS